MVSNNYFHINNAYDVIQHCTLKASHLPSSLFEFNACCHLHIIILVLALGCMCVFNRVFGLSYVFIVRCYINNDPLCSFRLGHNWIVNNSHSNKCTLLSLLLCNDAAFGLMCWSVWYRFQEITWMLKLLNLIQSWECL